MLPQKIEQSKSIITKAIQDFKPYKIVIMISGGDDSLTVLALCKYLGIKVDYLIHANTGTGLPQATDFVRKIAEISNIAYLEGQAQRDYINYVTRKGFFGRGNKAHSFAYHVLKANYFRKLVSTHIRQRKRNRKVLLLNGVRLEESQKRMDNFANKVYRHDPAAKSNIWVNIIQYWTKEDCLYLLNGMNQERSPVAKCLNRSGECMCGTMQDDLDRYTASKFDPTWGKWLDDLEKHVINDCGFPWKWGSDIPKTWQMEQQGQLSMFSKAVLDFMPACHSCKQL
ncbi:MAG: phosphoadenosine phosphosulfate reductase family protein [Bacteroidota bacterium]